MHLTISQEKHEQFTTFSYMYYRIFLELLQSQHFEYQHCKRTITGSEHSASGLIWVVAILILSNLIRCYDVTCRLLTMVDVMRIKPFIVRYNFNSYIPSRMYLSDAILVQL